MKPTLIGAQSRIKPESDRGDFMESIYAAIIHTYKADRPCPKPHVNDRGEIRFLFFVISGWLRWSEGLTGVETVTI